MKRKALNEIDKDNFEDVIYINYLYFKRKKMPKKLLLAK
jgi:hypothetical protein